MGSDNSASERLPIRSAGVRSFTTQRRRCLFLLCLLLLALVATAIVINERFALRLLVEQEQSRRTFGSGFAGILAGVQRRLTHVLSENDAAKLNLDVDPAVCAHVVRLGHAADGGWDVCEDLIPHADGDGAGCIVYSIGINDDTSFDEHLIARYPHCSVFAFDPTIGRETGDDFHFSEHGIVRFYNIGLGPVDVAASKHAQGWEVQSLPSIMKMLGHAHVHVLKMDIEGTVKLPLDVWGMFAQLLSFFPYSILTHTLLTLTPPHPHPSPPLSSTATYCHVLKGASGTHGTHGDTTTPSSIAENTTSRSLPNCSPRFTLNAASGLAPPPYPPPVTVTLTTSTCLG